MMNGMFAANLKIVRKRLVIGTWFGNGEAGNYSFFFSNSPKFNLFPVSVYQVPKW